MSIPAYDIWLAAIHLTARKKGILLDSLGSAEAVFNASHADLRAIKQVREKDIEKLDAERESAKKAAHRAIRYMKRTGTVCLTQDDPRFPEELCHIDNPPAALFARGDVSLLTRRAKLAMVGSRKASGSGMKTARTFGQEFSKAGITIVSGLAEGIDAASAKAALAEVGSTIAVLGTGIDICYPSINQELYNDIAERGLLLSEFFFGEAPQAFHFPMRNRIISGLADGVLVVEAAAKSGALITASHAAEQGKEVYAVPHDIHVPQGVGCNQLIKDGAKMVTEAQDVLEDYGVDPNEAAVIQPKVDVAVSDAEQVLLDAIKGGITTVDDLVVKTGQPIAALNATLMMLELKDLISVSFGEINLR